MHEILSKVIANLWAKGFSVLLVLAMHIAFANWLSPTEYGQFALLQVVAMGLAIFAQAGMQNAYMKLVSESKDFNAIYPITKYCMVLVSRNLFISLVVYLVIAVIIYLTGRISSVLALLFFLIYFISQTFMFILLAWYRAINKAYISSFLEQGSFAGLSVIFGLFWITFNSSELNLAQVSLFYALAIIIALFFAGFFWFKVLLKKKGENSDINKLRIAQLSQRFLIMQLAQYIALWCGVLVVGVLLAAEEVAQLNIAQRIAQIVTFFLIAFNGVVAPRFAALNLDGDMIELKMLAQKSALMLSFSTLPIIFCIVLFGERILSLFGNLYITAYPILLVIMVGQLINAMTGSVGYLLNMTDHERTMKNIVIVSSLITFLVSIFFTLQWGILGAAIAVSSGLAINNLTAAFFVYKYLGFLTIPGLHWVKRHAY